MWLLQHGHKLGDEHGQRVDYQLAEQIHRLTTAHLQFNLEAGLKTLRIMEQA